MDNMIDLMSFGLEEVMDRVNSIENEYSLDDGFSFRELSTREMGSIQESIGNLAWNQFKVTKSLESMKGIHRLWLFAYTINHLSFYWKGVIFMAACKNYETCFYNHKGKGETCECLTSMVCKDDPGHQCSFWIPKEEYHWGKNRHGAQMPIHN